MSDAQAAQVTENGVPPAAQDLVIEEAPTFKIFVGNLAYSTTEEGLRSFFAPVQSDITSVQVITRGQRPAGYGFVAMSTEETAQKAVELLAGQELDGRKVIVEIAKPADQKDKEKRERRTKWRPGRRGSKPVPGEVTEAEANGDIKPDDARKPRRKAVPAETSQEATAEASAVEDVVTEAPAAPKKQQRRRPRFTRPQRPVGEDPVGEPSKTMLFVANLGFSIDDEGLSALFTEAGITVVSARVVRRRWGRFRKSKGYGFVDVGSEEEQQKAIEALQGKDVGGRAIAVKIAYFRRQREQESREDGLSKSLFERARQDKDAGANKALGIMMKMGFQLGQSLGKPEDSPSTKVVATPDASHPPPVSHSDSSKPKHNVEPLPLNEWAGKKGIGLGKRSRSPGASERIAKMAKMADEAERESFRDRSRREFEQRHAESRLVLAQRTCTNLDEEAGISFNVFWLNPNDADTIPPALCGALSESFSAPSATGGGEAAKLRKQMQADALVSMGDNYVDDDGDLVNEGQPESRHQEVFTPETVQEAVHFLRLGVNGFSSIPCDRLSLILAYLREEYTYCFWCGTRYDDYADLKQHCPGPGEEDHD
ncbi:hypothetical protein F5141DRAFT_1189526 [Pisolithus sp. B1]|nr:hypothetical protein F5141DRAFT_1189526 [Pisolithus sp. B1]